MKKYIGLFILITISVTTRSAGQSYHSLVHNSRMKYLSMETMCAIVRLTSEKENVISNSTKLIYADNRNRSWRLIVLPDYHRYLFYDGKQTYSFNEESKTYVIDTDTLAILRFVSYLDNISGLLLSRDTSSSKAFDTTTREKVVDIGKGIKEIIVTSDDLPEYNISDFIFRMDIDTIHNIPIRASTTYLFLGALVSERIELDTVYESSSEADAMFKKVHEMIEAYKLIEHEEAKALTEKVFSYQQVLEKLVFVNQLSPTSRFYLLDFYYENCAPCLKSISYLKNLEHDFSSATLSVIAVNPYDTKEKIENYAVKNQISYAEAMIDKEFVDDSIGHIGYPFFVLFDREGKIVLKQTGFDPAFFDKVREIINK